MYHKDFENWHSLKQAINNGERIPTFRKREIWWCSTGVNVGVEQDGKNKLFDRPVLIIRKFNKRLFWGVPLTTQIKDFPFHFSIHFKGHKETESKERQAILSQLRAYDASRLTRQLGKLAEAQFEALIRVIHGALDGP